MKFLPNLSTPLYVALETDEVELGQAKEKVWCMHMCTKAK